MKTIYLWSDLREKSLHQKYIADNYKDVLQKMGFNVRLNQSKDWANTWEEVRILKPALFFLHGGKVFDPHLLHRINQICKVYIRWRWHPDPPKHLIDNCHCISKVSFVNDTYNGKLFYSPHPAITKYFKPTMMTDKKYETDICFLGLAGKRGNHFYTRSKRNELLESKYVTHINKKILGDPNLGFYDYPEINKYYNSCRMVLNVSSFPDEVNFRVFNAMACKVPVISDSTPSMRKHFQDNHDYVAFQSKNLKDFEYYVKTMVRNLSVTARKGYEKIMAEHTPEIRLKEVLNVAGVKP